MKIKSLFLPLLFPVLIYSQNSDIFKYAFSANKSDIYIKEEGNYLAWVKVINEKTRFKNTKTGKFYFKGGGHTLQYWKCDCNNKTYDLDDVIVYSDKGNIISSEDKYAFNERIIPESIGEHIFNIICGFDYYYEDKYLKEVSFEESFKIYKDLGGLLSEEEFADKLLSGENPMKELSK